MTATLNVWVGAQISIFIDAGSREECVATRDKIASFAVLLLIRLAWFCCEKRRENIATTQARWFQHWNWIRQSCCVAERLEGADVEPLGRNGPLGPRRHLAGTCSDSGSANWKRKVGGTSIET